MRATYGPVPWGSTRALIDAYEQQALVTAKAADSAAFFFF
jgi:hypothetical protein